MRFFKRFVDVQRARAHVFETRVQLRVGDRIDVTGLNRSTSPAVAKIFLGSASASDSFASRSGSPLSRTYFVKSSALRPVRTQRLRSRARTR
jgi:hypothetical protein